MKGKNAIFTALIGLSAFISSICSCFPPTPPDDPDTVSSVLTLDNRGFAESSMLVNDEPAEWDASGKAVYESSEGADYTVEALNAPEGEELVGFWVGLSGVYTMGGEGAIGELSRSNPLRLHVEKNQIIVWPVYDADQEEMAAMARFPRLPEGIILR